MSAAEHFPRMILKHTQVKKQTLEGYETVEEFLARGGKIQHIPVGQSSYVETGKRTLVNKMKKMDEARAKELGRI